jgi:hypothetical protein
VLQLRRDGSPKLSPPYEDPSDLNVFRAVLISTVWKMNRGMAIDTNAWPELGRGGVDLSARVQTDHRNTHLQGKELQPVETAITRVSPPELTLTEEEKGQLFALVQIKLEETKTLTIVSKDERFETAGEQLRAIARLRERIKGTLKPSTGRWKRGAVQEARSGAVPKGERGRPAPGGGAASARGRGTAPEAGRGRSQAKGKRGSSRERKLEEEALAGAAGDHQTAELILEHAVQQTEAVPEPMPQVPVVVLAPVVAARTLKVRGVASAKCRGGGRSAATSGRTT